jgi:hypothetical protein
VTPRVWYSADLSMGPPFQRVPSHALFNGASVLRPGDLNDPAVVSLANDAVCKPVTPPVVRTGAGIIDYATMNELESLLP